MSLKSTNLNENESVDKIDYSGDRNSTEELEYDEEEKKFLNDMVDEDETDNYFKILITFGYVVNINDSKEIRLKLGDSDKKVDCGLIAGLTQNDEIVDAYFLGNKFAKDKNIIFEKDEIKANGKTYNYEDLRIHMTPSGAFIVSKDENDLIVRLDDDAYQMFSSVLGNNSDNTCVISVIDSKVCACCISDGELIWANPINLGKNRFIEKSGEILTNKSKYNINDCYLRGCIKNIYLHVDINDPPSTLILGSVFNPFYNLDNFDSHN